MCEITSFFHAAGDGVFSTIKDGVVQLVDLKTNSTKDLVKLKDVHDVRAAFFDHFIYISDQGIRKTANRCGSLIGKFRPIWRTC